MYSRHLSKGYISLGVRIVRLVCIENGDIPALPECNPTNPQGYKPIPKGINQSQRVGSPKIPPVFSQKGPFHKASTESSLAIGMEKATVHAKKILWKLQILLGSELNQISPWLRFLCCLFF